MPEENDSHPGFLLLGLCSYCALAYHRELTLCPADALHELLQSGPRLHLEASRLAYFSWGANCSACMNPSAFL
jgi:hypothetical protein